MVGYSWMKPAEAKGWTVIFGLEYQLKQDVSSPNVFRTRTKLSRKVCPGFGNPPISSQGIAHSMIITPVPVFTALSQEQFQESSMM